MTQQVPELPAAQSLLPMRGLMISRLGGFPASTGPHQSRSAPARMTGALARWPALSDRSSDRHRSVIAMPHGPAEWCTTTCDERSMQQTAGGVDIGRISRGDHIGMRMERLGVREAMR